jgi:aminoglycoside N3'-acetyltransferase
MSYDAAGLASALRGIGIGRGETIYLSTQLFGLGPMAGAASREALVAGFYAGIRQVIGPEGTLVVPTFTQQVGRYGLPYIHEQTESLTGIFGEHVRRMDGARRSLHPVFSVCAIGPRADDITDRISGVAFGRLSAFDRLYELGGKAVCAGFSYHSGHITSLMHYVETAFAVPYYYNKLVTAEVWAGGERVPGPFAINVKYAGTGSTFDYRRYIDALAERDEIRGAPLGRGQVYAVDIRRQVDVGLDLLRSDVYAFLSAPPRFQPGQVPLDGPPEAGKAPPNGGNWAGFLIGV